MHHFSLTEDITNYTEKLNGKAVLKFRWQPMAGTKCTSQVTSAG